MDIAWNIIGMLGALATIGFLVVITYCIWKERK